MIRVHFGQGIIKKRGLSDDEEIKMFHDARGHSREACPRVRGKAARIAAEIILREREKVT